jgi:hypothetical protein
MPFAPLLDFDDPHEQPARHSPRPRDERIFADLKGCNHPAVLFEFERKSYEKTGEAYCFVCHEIRPILKFRSFGEPKRGGKA